MWEVMCSAEAEAEWTDGGEDAFGVGGRARKGVAEKVYPKK